MDPDHNETKKHIVRGGHPNAGGGAAPSQARELLPGELVADGRYKVEFFVGRGAVGSVYAVEQVFLKKRFALKMLIPAGASDSILRRFQKEGQAASRLDHPNLVRAVDFGLIDGNRPFIIMDFVEGQTLGQYLKKNGTLPLNMALQVFIPVCLAMDYAHKQGVIHRDITPNNIVLVPSQSATSQFTPRIIDFGIAKLASDDETALTKVGEIFGTPLYMSPEQCLGARIDNRSDLYSLGCVLFEVLTGSPPFRAETALKTMMQHREDRPYSLKEASLGSQFPEALERIVAAMLAKDPEDRYRSCGEVAQDLIWLQQGEPERVLATSPGYDTATTKSASRSKSSGTAGATKIEKQFARQTIMVAAAAIVIFGIGIFLTRYLSDDKPAPALRGPEKSNNAAEPNLVADDPHGEGYFSRVEKNVRSYHVPLRLDLGEFTWWQDDRLQRVATKTKRDFDVPLDARLMLSLAPQIYMENPSYFARLAKGELSGLLITNAAGEARKAVDEEQLDRLFSFTRPLQSVRLIYWNLGEVPEDTLESISTLPNLHWLCLHEGVAQDERLAELKNLHQLKVLSFRSLNHVKDLIQQIIKKNHSLRRLAMLNSHVTLEDLQQLSHVRTLDTLDLKENSLKGRNGYDQQSVWTALRQMPELRRLSLGASFFRELEIPEAPKHMKKLDTLVFNYCSKWPGDFKDRLKKAYLPYHINVIVDDDHAMIVDHWFDPLKTDPAKDDLW
jgi:eukaryotic-like serine/threonine-protein kinase